MLLVTLADAEASRTFLATRWPQARVIADPDRTLRRAFGIRRGGARAFLAPGVWLAGARAMLEGHGVGKPVGDVRSMPGMALVAGDRVLWEQVFQHVGARPDLAGARAAWQAWRAEAHPPETSTSASAAGGVSSSSSSR